MSALFYSSYAFIHTKRRNRLTVTRAGKISFISFNYNLEMAQRLKKQRRKVEQSVDADNTIDDSDDKEDNTSDG